jgi:adenine phosphoribosyltransferase
VRVGGCVTPLAAAPSATALAENHRPGRVRDGLPAVSAADKAEKATNKGHDPKEYAPVRPPATGFGAVPSSGLDADFHDELVSGLQYFDGHSDTLGLFANAGFLRRAAAAVAAPFRGAGVQKVAGIEARGFVLAAAVALELDVGFVAVRKPGSIHPGTKVELTAPPDWHGNETMLRLQRHVIAPGDAVLVVDDWAETGSKAVTARRLVIECGGRYVGLSLLVDQLPEAVRGELAPVAAVARADEVRGG